VEDRRLPEAAASAKFRFKLQRVMVVVTSGLGLGWPDHHLLIAITAAAFSRGSKESNSASGDDYNYTRGDASTFKFISFAGWILPQPVSYNALFE
jgi:hypothetical protein